MLESSKIAELKAEHGQVFEIPVDAQNSVVFRALTFAEFDRLAINEDYVSSVDSEDDIVRTALLHPEFDELEKLSAGIISGLCEEIIEQSSFFDISKATENLNTAREKKNDVRTLMKAFVITAMPAYKPSELDDLTFAELSELVSLAEQILELQVATFQTAFVEGGEAPTMLLIDEEAEAVEQARQNDMHNLTRKDGAAVAGDPIAEKLHQAF